jgi:uroporphyrinogen-III decarboxylase
MIMDSQTAAAPLSEAERVHFQELFEKRLRTVKAKTDDVFAFRETACPPFIVNGAFYTIFGIDTGMLPDAYFDVPELMTNFQERMYYEQVKAIEDDFVPYLMPWFGTAVVASAFGCQINFNPKLDPAADPHFYPVVTAEDVRKLQIPDPNKDGLMPRVLDVQRYMKRASFLPVGVTDLQGPLTTANQLMGYDKLIYLMTDDPSAAHELMEKVTEALICWVKAQKTVIGEPLTECIGVQQFYTGRHAGIWISDDDTVIMSPKYYREFVVPYNSRLLKAFGGGCLHFCGGATHQIDNLLATDGVVALHNFTLYNSRPFHALRARLEGRRVLFACDMTPVDYESYFSDLLDGVALPGLEVSSWFSPVLALLPGGKYEAVRRDPVSGRRRVFEHLKQRLGA